MRIRSIATWTTTRAINALARTFGTLLAAIGLVSALPAHAQDQPTPEEVVNALEGAYGVHPGRRRNHAKGTCALGSFVGKAEAADYSRSALFAGVPIPVVARFSLAGGNPEASDAERSPRGMALEFQLPNGALQHMTMIDSPTFFAALPRTFLDKMLALRPDPATGQPDPKALEAFAASHPDSRGQAEFFADHTPPVSYANDTFFGIHTFRFVDRDGEVTLVKWRFVPRDGEKRLADAQLASMPRDFLENALIERTHAGPVHWDMRVTIGEAGDPADDSTLAWPAGRRELVAGTLEITSAMPQAGAACAPINYDPLVMADGIAPTNDPVLLFRSPSYGISFLRRVQGR